MSGVFTFDLFPDQPVIDLHKITYIHNVFFDNRDVVTILVQEPEEVSVETNIFFTALRLTRQGQEPLLIKFLPRHQANQAGRLLRGTAGCNKAGIELSSWMRVMPLRKLSKLGSFTLKSNSRC